MNELDYASLEASKKLHEAGIVLETDALWSLFLDGFHLIMNTELHPLVENYPAPSIAEVWRELPDINQGARIYLTKIGNQTQVGYGWPYMPSSSVVGQNISPADALIELLIWLRKEASHD